MTNIFWKVFSRLVLALLSLRYSIQVKGREKLTPEALNRKGGVLFLPNHTAHVDPLILFLLFWPDFKMRPLVIEYICRLPIMSPVHRLIRSIPVPNFETGVNEYKLKQAERSIHEIAEGLQEGNNFIVYPSGMLKNTGKELLAGSAGAHELMEECPDANVVMIRTTGLWGSSFSRAFTKKSPDLMKTTFHGIRVVLKNFIFFSPRRKLLIEVEPNPEDFPRTETSRLDLNRYLENWYNRYPDENGNVSESEPINLVSYSMWKREVPEVYDRNKKNPLHDIPISDETRDKVYGEIKKILENDSLEIKPEMSLTFDLGMDSLNVAEFITFLSKHFELGRLHPEDLETVGSVLALAEGGGQARKLDEPPSEYTWPEENRRPAPALPIGRTVPEAFLNSCQRLKGFSACGDDVAGVLSYDRLKIAVLTLAQYFQKYKEERIAVLLPASVGAYLTILAIQMAGKTPVMLNWTLGPRYLQEMMSLSESKAIITSWKFLDRLSNVQFGPCLDKLVLLEDIKKTFTLAQKLRALYLSKCSVHKVLESMGIDTLDENQPCVILFTSGTEASPKGVPLSHKNIISNQRSAMQCIDLRARDVMYGVLPPFHTFGFSVAGLFPILGGLRIAYYPDPTDNFALAEGVKRWNVGYFCSPPAFLKGLFSAADEDQLQSVRFFVSGAEKATNELYERVENLKGNAKLIEGYGITECSPILSLMQAHTPQRGVGRLIPDVELITIHPETEEKLNEGEDGELCVRGPNIFGGYLGNPRAPFIEIDGKQWYRTGDLGHILPDRTLILSGRLKRFTKVAGEMISLGAIEEVLTKKLIEESKINPDIPSLAVCADEKEEGKPHLIVFTTIDLSKDEANKIIQDSGFSNLVKISSVKKVQEIPLLGAGKTHYRKLMDLC